MLRLSGDVDCRFKTRTRFEFDGKQSAADGDANVGGGVSGNVAT